MAEITKSYCIPGTELQIYGKLREVPGAPIVVLVHCLGGWMDATEYYVGARALERAGYASFRFDLYNGHPDSRSLIDCTLSTHAADFDLVVEQLKIELPGRPVIAAGHSLGGLTILASQRRAHDAVVLWDATHTGHWEGDGIEDATTRWEPALGLYRLTGGLDVLVTEDFLASYRFLDCDRLVDDLDLPLLSVVAGDNVPRGVAARIRYHDRAPGPKKLVVIDEADHSFSNGETLDRVHRETIAWLGEAGFPAALG